MNIIASNLGCSKNIQGRYKKEESCTLATVQQVKFSTYSKG